MLNKDLLITSGTQDRVIKVNASHDKTYHSTFYNKDINYIWLTMYFENGSKELALCSVPFMEAVGKLEEYGDKRNQQIAKFLGSKAQRNVWVCAYQDTDEETGNEFYTIQRQQNTADVTYEE